MVLRCRNDGVQKPAVRIAFILAGLSLAAISAAHPVKASNETFNDGLAAYDAGDLAATVHIWRALAEAGDANAQAGLAGLYLAGSGVTRDPIEAARLYRLAAANGDSNGQLNLGRLYLDGVGVERDLGLAYAWLTLAARQGRRWAEEKRREIEPALSVADRAEAEALITDIEGR